MLIRFWLNLCHWIRGWSEPTRMDQRFFDHRSGQGRTQHSLVTVWTQSSLILLVQHYALMEAAIYANDRNTFFCRCFEMIRLQLRPSDAVNTRVLISHCVANQTDSSEGLPAAGTPTIAALWNWLLFVLSCYVAVAFRRGLLGTQKFWCWYDLALMRFGAEIFSCWDVWTALKLFF